VPLAALIVKGRLVDEKQGGGRHIGLCHNEGRGALNKKEKGEIFGGESGDKTHYGQALGAKGGGKLTF